jgi:hypothetical protein
MAALERYRGDTYPVVFTVKDADGVVVNITGWDFVLTIDQRRSPEDDTTVVHEITGILSNSTGGEVTFPFTGVSLDVQRYYYDIEATDTSGNIYTLVKDSLRVLQDITK